MRTKKRRMRNQKKQEPKRMTKTFNVRFAYQLFYALQVKKL
jgi:hypothetical protein